MTDSGTDITTLSRRALAEVCTVPVFIVFNKTERRVVCLR